MAQSASSRYQLGFGPFTVDLRSAELKKYGANVKIQDRPFEILAMLLEKPGEVVTREEIRTRLWPEGTFVDFDNNINASIGKLRAALSDSAASPRYIETVGRGYRFIGEVTKLPEAFELATAAVEAEPAPPVSAPTELPRSRHMWVSVVAVALLVIAALLVYSLL